MKSVGLRTYSNIFRRRKKRWLLVRMLTPQEAVSLVQVRGFSSKMQGILARFLDPGSFVIEVILGGQRYFVERG